MDTSITTIEQSASEHIGNTLEKGIRGEYDFAVGRILSEAWEKTYGFKATYWRGILWMLLIVLAIIVASAVIGFILGLVIYFIQASHETLKMSEHVLNNTLQLIYSLFIFPPITAGFLMLSVKKLVDLPARGRAVLSYFGYWNKLWWPIFILAALAFVATFVSILVAGVLSGAAWIGGLIGVVGGLLYIYLLVGYIFFPLLVVEKKLSGWNALEASRKAVSYHWFKIAWLFIVMLLIFLGSLLTLGVLLIWTMPMLNNAMAILYREVFGIDKL